jgi:hypothetical protein
MRIGVVGAAPRALTTVVVAMGLPAAAASYTVTNTDDAGAGSLRQAIIDANTAGGSNTITFTVGGTITLLSELPVITSAVAIDGGGNTPTVSGNNNYRVFFVNAPGAAVSFSNLEIANGRANGGNGGGGGGGGMGAGGAIFAMSGNVTLTDVGLSGNVAHGGNGQSGAFGGAAGWAAVAAWAQLVMPAAAALAPVRGSSNGGRRRRHPRRW